MSLPSGTRLAQYEILAPLGSGGMGEVYRARDSRLKRDVAIKVMAAHIAADPDARTRFETEARAVAALSHPSIMSIYELAIVDGVPISVMELLEGETLRKCMERGPMPWREAVEIGAAVAEGLAAAHGKGVIHRDLKPENVFRTNEGVTKILDFGLALHRLEAAGMTADGPTVARTAQGIVLGTFGYMSPEQVLGERVDGRSDIFALGCLLYEMLSGRRLFPGQTPQEVIANVLHGSAPDLSSVDPHAPAELRSIVMRSVARDPQRRFESARDLAMALRALLAGSSSAATSRRPRPRGKSLAVLPFLNTGADPEIEYLTDGITESIINSLSQLDGLRVVPRSLVFRYKGLQSDPATIGLALNARTILTGRVARYGDILNIQAELVDTATESQLWGEQFRQSTTDLMTVQEEIAWQISEALRLKLTGAQKKRLRKRHTVNPEAYHEYLRGRYHWNNWTPDGLRRALEHFERALALDPAYALAFAGLADAFGAMAYYGFVPPADGFPRARAAAMRALDLDGDLADAHVSLAMALFFHDWNWAEAERSLKTALKLNPKLSLAHSVYALLLSASGRHDQALDEARAGRDLEPLSVFANMGVCWAVHFAGRAEEAVREAQRVRDLVPDLEEAGNVLITAYERLGRFEDAVHVMRKQRVWGVPLDADAMLAAYREGGAEGYWRMRLELLDRAQARPGASRTIPFQYATAHVCLGELDEAIDHLARMVEERVAGAVFLGTDVSLTALRGVPRYDALLERIGIPVPPQTTAGRE